MLPVKTFCAALHFARAASATVDVRYYLIGTLLEFKAPRSLHIVATDGHRMHVVELQTDEHGLDGSFLIGSGDVEKILALHKKSDGAVEFYPAENGALGVVNGQSLATFPVINRRFPEWRRVVPTGEIAAAPAHFNPAYLEAASKAANALQKRQKFPVVKLSPIAGSHSAVMRVDVVRTDFPEIVSAFAIVMGMKE